jgi:23S rRNA (adenine2503-C2)-methyltransferase
MTGPAPRHLVDLSPAERRTAAAALGEPAYRADQLSRHYFFSLNADPAAMTDLPRSRRLPLAQALLPELLEPVRHVCSDGGRTRKTLWRAADSTLVESVLMRYPGRATVCVSSQAGCGMGCPFCATGQGGLTRNLSAGEIVAQVVESARMLGRGELPGGPGRLSHVVFMGMGEPLANYRATTAAVRRITEPAPHGLGLSQRSITVSTVGLAPAIRRLAGEDLAITLAVSLHAPDDELRDSLVPINRRYPVAEVLEAGFDYVRRTGRRLSVEYTLIAGVNDQPARAEKLAELLAGRAAHVNLIPLNPTAGSDWRASAGPVIRQFADRLRAAGIATTVRDTRGRHIDGACGQLAAGNGRGAGERH